MSGELKASITIRNGSHAVNVPFYGEFQPTIEGLTAMQAVDIARLIERTYKLGRVHGISEITRKLTDLAREALP